MKLNVAGLAEGEVVVPIKPERDSGGVNLIVPPRPDLGKKVTFTASQVEPIYAGTDYYLQGHTVGHLIILIQHRMKPPLDAHGAYVAATRCPDPANIRFLSLSPVKDATPLLSVRFDESIALWDASYDAEGN